jgi:hypothetical protein
MLEDMQLRGLSPKTQRCYIHAVQQVGSGWNAKRVLPPDPSE